MAPLVQLYVWALPAGSPDDFLVDHTWVTTYDNRIQGQDYQTDAAVAAAGQFYWYCWGSFHPQATGDWLTQHRLLAQRQGDLSVAQCVAEANADSQVAPCARGTIYTYGVDGVCHQLANQVLSATGGTSPLTCKGARGYWLSTHLYGTYGLQHAAWTNKSECCSGTADVALTEEGAILPGLPDDFEMHARQVLQERDPLLLAKLLALRADTQRFLAQRWPGVMPPSAEALNARNQHLINEAARLLGPEKFREVFEHSPEDRIHLVDPSIRQR
jgi:hypothetical protein